MRHAVSRLRIAKHINHIHRLWDSGQRRVNLLPQQRLPRQFWADRDHLIPLCQQICHHTIAGPRRVIAGADQRDGFHLLQQLNNLLILHLQLPFITASLSISSVTDRHSLG
ncbi:hypothetical protein AK51_15280 [Serratia nematodiphila DZ0503SBS1]|nr:hypothetical protein AK51_15280 [Serratia nematodiphila DZ0503SBS1]